MDYECDTGYIRTEDGRCVIIEDEAEKALAKKD